MILLVACTGRFGCGNSRVGRKSSGVVAVGWWLKRTVGDGRRNVMTDPDFVSRGRRIALQQKLIRDRRIAPQASQVRVV
jgi:hypothetical protein